jgi:hypothetical protein
MSVTIRPASLDLDRSFLTGLLSRNLGISAVGPRFDWLYLQNPHGAARVWIAVEVGTEQTVGMASAFPRMLSLNGSSCPGYVLGDFCIDVEHRSLGLAVRLQKACSEFAGSTSLTPHYDFPSDRMMAIYRRMEIAPIGQMVRWSKPLRMERKIGKAVRSGKLARYLALPMNKILKWKDSMPMWDARWSIAEHEGECADEFTQLARNVGSQYGVCVERSAEYLNWRFLRHPLVRHRLLTARWGGQLTGYVMFSRTAEDAKIVDLFGLGDAAMWTALVARLVIFCHARKIATVSIPALVTCPWAPLLRKWGFHQRESCPVVASLCGKNALANGDLALRWFLTDGDRES